MGSEHFQSIWKRTYMYLHAMFYQSSLVPIPCQPEDLLSIQKAPYHWLPARGPPAINHQQEDPVILGGQPEEVPTFAIPVELWALPAISFGEDTFAHEPASFPSTSIEEKLADPEALAFYVDAPVLWTGGNNKRNEPASSFHANFIAPAVPNTIASCPSSSTNSEAPATSLASSIDLSGKHIILIGHEQCLSFE